MRSSFVVNLCTISLKTRALHFQAHEAVAGFKRCVF